MKQTKVIENKSGWLIGGGVLAALTASLCCIGPLILTVIGISGAAVLSKIEVIRIPMIFIVIVFFGIAGFALFKKKSVCAPGSICADPKKYKQMIWAYGIGFFIAVLLITSPYWVTYIFE